MPAADRGISRQDDGRRRAVAACVFFSGVAALIWQVVSVRQFSFELGTTLRSTLVVLTTCLLGMAVGATFAGRRAATIARPMRTLALLQGGIAASALAAPLALSALGAAYVWIFGQQPAPPDAADWRQAVFAFIAAFAALALPSALSAAVLPVAARLTLRRNGGDGATVAAVLLGVAALGAVCGTLAAAFALIPAIGLNATAWTGIAINLAMFAALIRLSPGAEAADDAQQGPSSAQGSPGFHRRRARPPLGRDRRRQSGWRAAFGERPAWALLPAVLVSVAAAVVVETVWIRLLSHTLGSDSRASALVVATILGGLALGDLLVARLAVARRHAGNTFVWLQNSSAAAALLIYIGLALRPAVPVGRWSLALAGGVCLPAALLVGASVPAALRILAAQAEPADRAVARILAWGAAGAALAALVVGPWLLPALGFAGAIELAAAAQVGIALWIAIVMIDRRPIAIGASGCALLAVALVLRLPQPSSELLPSDLPSIGGGRPEEIFYGVGPSTTVVALERDGIVELRSDGETIAKVEARGSPPAQDAQKWLAALPVTVRPDAQSMLLLGFAGTATLEGVPASVGRIDIVESDRELIEASVEIGRARGEDLREDPRVRIARNDARLAMRLTSQRYDAIVSQARAPAWRGAYSREFLGAAKTRLADGGVFAQGIRSASVDAQALRAWAATLASQFAHVRLYRPTSDTLIFLASERELEPELQLSRSGEPITDDVMHFSRMGMNGLEDLIAALVADEAGVAALAADTTIATDDHPSLGGARAPGLAEADLTALLAPHDPLLSPRSWLYARLADRVDFGYVTRRLIRLGRQARAVAAAEAQPDDSTRLLMLGILYASRGERGQAVAAFRAALERRPENVQARYLLIEPSIGLLARDEADPDTASLARGLPPSASAVIEGWRHASSQRWESVAQLDGDLGRAALTDAWYPDAVRLRADWRSKVTQNVEQFAFDALRLIDRAILIEPSLNLYLLRAAVGIAIDDAGVAIESSREVVRLIREDLEQRRVRDGRISQGELAIMRQNVSAVTTNLRGELIAGEERRAERVRQNANQILRYIDAVTAPEEK